MTACLNDFCKFYENFEKNNLFQLKEIYADNVQFIDPSHEIIGLSNLQSYFSVLMTEIEQCDFVIGEIFEKKQDTFVKNQEAMVLWEMTFAHPQLNKGKSILVPGNSHIKFDHKIYYHRDYFDTTSMLYEYIPLLGFIIKKIKQRMLS